MSAAEADRYAERCADALETLAEAMASWPGQAGAQPLRQGLGADARAAARRLPSSGATTPRRRLRPLLAQARDLGAHLHVDMESLDSLETTLGLVFGLLEEDEFRDGPSAGLVLQAYLRDSPDELERILDWSRGSGRRPPLTIRLVKGAYWDHEVIEAQQHGWGAPVFESKAECDRNFEELTRRLLDARPLVRVAIASHNLRSVAHALAYAGDADLEVQVLRGLGDDLAHALARRGGARSRLLPRGRPRRGHGLPGPPAAGEHGERVVPARPGARRRGRGAAGRAVKPFANEPELELRRESNRGALTEALGRLDARLPLSVPVLVGDEEGASDGFESTDPGSPERVVATAGRAGAAEAAAAVEAAAAAAPGWGETPARERAEKLVRGRRCSCAATGSTSPRSRCASARSRGRRPTPTCARRSTSSSTTRARPSSSSARRNCSRCAASATRCATRAAAWRR